MREEVRRQIQLEKANIAVKEEEIEAVGQLRDIVQQNIKDVDEQYESFKLFATEEQDVEQQNSMYQSITNTQGKVKKSLADFSRTLKGDVKQLVDETLEEFKKHVEEKQWPIADPMYQFDKIKDHLNQLDNRSDVLEQVIKLLPHDTILELPKF